MTLHSIEPGLARLMKLGLASDIESRIVEWQKRLDENTITDEMRAVFIGLGWLTSNRDSRIREVDEAPKPEPEQPKAREQLGATRLHGETRTRAQAEREDVTIDPREKPITPG